jgi:hypothetical protein
MPYALHTQGQRVALVEATRVEIRTDPTLRRVDGPTAHRWVKAGRLHETGLWVDDTGRIRYAKPGI